MSKGDRAGIEVQADSIEEAFKTAAQRSGGEVIAMQRYEPEATRGVIDAANEVARASDEVMKAIQIGLTM